MAEKDSSLGRLRAIWNAFWGVKVSYYPQALDGSTGKSRRIEESEIMQDIAKTLSTLNPDESIDIQAYLERGRESLNEVKALTEYQDQKATNLLTTIAFLTALAGALFTKFVEIYPIHATRSGYGSLAQLLCMIASYVLFALFILTSVSGALVIFHATKTQFKYPKSHAPVEPGSNKRANSYLFVTGIIDANPAQWATSFLRSQGFFRHGGQEEAIQIDPALQLNYFKNYVGESYLVACKAADKIRYLQPGQAILLLSIRILLLWVMSMGLTWVFVKPLESAPAPVQQQSGKPPIPSLIRDQTRDQDHSLAAPPKALPANN